MKIVSIDEKPAEYYSYLVVKKGGRDATGNRVIEKVDLPILLGTISGLDEDIDALIATSDLQGTVIELGDEYLVGEKLPEFLSMFIEIELLYIDKNKIGIFLCGDLFANSEKRGGLGDVKKVWGAFNKYFKWVAGVAGNHDDFGLPTEFESFKQEKDIHYLNGKIKKIDGMNIGGIGGIIGKTDKPQRVEENSYLDTLKKLLLKRPSTILLHQSPSAVADHKSLDGNEEIKKIIENSPQNLIFCGHNHWSKPMATLENETQIINLDGRVVILINERNKRN